MSEINTEGVSRKRNKPLFLDTPLSIRFSVFCMY